MWRSRLLEPGVGADGERIGELRVRRGQAHGLQHLDDLAVGEAFGFELADLLLGDYGLMNPSGIFILRPVATSLLTAGVLLAVIVLPAAVAACSGDKVESTQTARRPALTCRSSCASMG